MRSTVRPAAVAGVMVAVLVGACARPTPEMQVIEDAAAALGGKERIQAVNAVTIEGEGGATNLGQNKNPDADLPTFKVVTYKKTIDLANKRGRLEYVRNPEYLTGNPAPQRQNQSVDGDVAYNTSPDGKASRASARTASDCRAELLHHPVSVVRAALDSAAKVTNPRKHESHDVVDIATADGTNVTLAIDSTTKLPAMVTTMTYNANLGDVALETAFADYQDFGGIKLPAQLTTKIDKYPFWNIRATKNTVDGEVPDLAAPADVKASQPAPEVAPPTVTVEQVAPGIWYLAGQSHHSVLIEFADHLTLIESPQNETRGLAAIAKARETVPGKPLTHLINTHHHYDHSGGVRAAVAEDLTIITHEGNKAFFEDMVSRKHTIVPDALQKNPKPLKLELVKANEPMILKDDTRTVELIPVSGSPHTDTMLMIYFPKEKLLSQADLYSPGTAAWPFVLNLNENIQARKLQIDRLLPIHGKVAPYSELQAKVKELQTPAPTATQ